MEGFLLAGCVSSLALAAGFGAVCVRYTRIFFSILTLALSQIVWALALKFFWITNGTDGLRIPTPTLLLGLVGVPDDKVRFLSFTYYYYVLAVFFICMVPLGIILVALVLVMPQGIIGALGWLVHRRSGRR